MTKFVDDFERLYSINKPCLYFLAFRILENSEDANDAVQESFLRAEKSFSTFSGNFTPWIRKIVRNYCLNFLRDKKKHLRIEKRLYLEGYFENYIDPLKFILCDRDYTFLYSGLKKLKKPQEDILVLYYFNGLSFKEISKELDIPIGTVMSRIYRARMSLEMILVSK